MDQIKVGRFLKELRSEKELTQEQLADHFCVTRRTVSRWETGNNLPDLDILCEMSDFYDVELRELLDGERKDSKVDKDLEETVMKVADYSNDDKLRLTKRMHYLFIAGLVTFIIFMVLYFNGMDDNFFGGVCLGVSFGMMIIGVLMTSKYAQQIRKYKKQLLRIK